MLIASDKSMHGACKNVGISVCVIVRATGHTDTVAYANTNS